MKQRLSLFVAVLALAVAVISPLTAQVVGGGLVQHNHTSTSQGGLITALVPVGTILDYAGSASLPSTFADTDGTAVSRSTCADLFNAIGVLWGAGDGSTTFNLPDLRRHTTIGHGGVASAGPANTVGSRGGSETHTLTAAQIPTITMGTGGAVGGAANGAWGNTNSVTGSISSTNTGGQAHPIMQPSATVRKIIKTNC